MKEKVYIAGKISGLDYEIVESLFDYYHNKYQNQGYDIINPYLRIKRWKLQEMPWENIMKITLSEMLTCDVVVILPNWKQSKGACIEHDLAEKLKIPIIYEDLCSYLIGTSFSKNKELLDTCEYRVVYENGNDLIVTHDFNLYRHNLSITNDQIVKITLG